MRKSYAGVVVVTEATVSKGVVVKDSIENDTVFLENVLKSGI